MTAPTCVTCKWHSESVSKGPGYVDRVHKCKYGEPDFDVVTGVYVEQSTDCYKARGGAGHCRPEGRHWWEAFDA